MKSEAVGPSESDPGSSASMSASIEGKRTVYATIKFVKKVDVFAAGPGNSPVYWRGQFGKGDEREVLWPDVDVTIGDSAAVQVKVDGKAIELPSGKITISFVKGSAKARSVES
ncbi:hypothetical protein EDD29_8265 [Actinocorallia herbida]|uniref:Uncharacterized protein n=2 Tax=Actinocorallia herbida TaxID=58109 RepID=A0A3N1DAK5_9ACTN|nr:hypothetical protein EDD29_8265 [Actinocorallia herbida]